MEWQSGFEELSAVNVSAKIIPYDGKHQALRNSSLHYVKLLSKRPLESSEAQSLASGIGTDSNSSNLTILQASFRYHIKAITRYQQVKFMDQIFQGRPTDSLIESARIRMNTMSLYTLRQSFLSALFHNLFVILY